MKMISCKRLSKKSGFLFALLISFTLIVSGCGGGETTSTTTSGGTTTTSGGTTTTSGGTTTTSGGAQTTSVSGKVTLSSTVGGGTTGLKARPKAFLSPAMAKVKGKPFGKVRKGEPGSLGNRLSKVVQRGVSRAATAATSAEVYLYDADHPEWLYPVATATVSSTDGSFTLDKLSYATENAAYGATYTNGASIPAGSYTLIAIGKDFSTSAVTTTTYPYYDSVKGKAYRLIVGVQAVVKKMEGNVDLSTLLGKDFEVQLNDATPNVVSIMSKKLKKLTPTSDTSQTSVTYDMGTIAANAAIEVIFDMAMHRVNTPDAITFKDSSNTVVLGKWKMSPDLKVANFYPTSNLTEGGTYTLTISSTGTSNYYGKGLKTDVIATFTAGTADTTAANVALITPDTQTDVPIYTSIKFGSNEPLDVNTFTITSTPGIGDKPLVSSLGYKNVTGQYDYTYQIDTGGSPLELNTDYAVTISGGEDLAGNSMTSVTFNFKTEATSEGVTAGSEVADSQAQVKGMLGDWLEAINTSDVSLFGSMMTSDFSMKYKKEDKKCTGCPQSFDLDKSKSLDYEEFLKFIEDWFNQNEKIADWTGTKDGLHLEGDVVSGTEIKVDETAGTAAFGFKMTYTKDDGTAYTSIGENGVIGPLYLLLKNVNGAWLLAEVSEKDNKDKIGVTSVSSITANTPTGEQSAGTKLVTFDWTPVSGVKSYAVVLIDTTDPKGETGWVGIVDAVSGETTKTLAYSATSDFDGSDGNLIIPGGGKDAPFAKKLTLSDGGSYAWFVAGFKTLAAADFGKGVEPDADMTAMSSEKTFSVAGTAVSGLKVTLQSSTGTPLTFSDTLYAWDAGSSTEATISISTTSKEGKIYVYGDYYAEYPFQVTSGKASKTIDLYEGYNWIDVTDGINWWYATTDETKGTSASNYIYTTKGVSYNLLTVESVTASGSTTPLTQDSYGYYNLSSTSTATSVKIKGTASSSTVYVYNSSGTAYTSTSAVVDKTTGGYEATVDIYSGYNWISLDDGFGNWAYVNIYNQGSGASTATDYITDIAIKDSSGVSATPDTSTGKYSVNTTSVTITGKLSNTGNGYWYAYGTKNYESGTLWRKSDGTFEFFIKVDSGDNYVYIYDSSWNYEYITISNASTTATASQANTIKEIGGMAHTAQQWDYYSHDAGSACSVTIKGSAPASSGKDIYLYLSNYGTTSVYDYQTTKADASGNYSFVVDIYNGTNYLDVYDNSWNWQGAKVTTTGTCSATTAAFDVTGVWKDASTQITLDSSGYGTTGASKVTIKGSAKSGKTVTAYVSGSYYNTYTTTALTSNTFEISVDIYSGYNYISLSDGSNWEYITVKTTGGATYTTLTAEVWTTTGTSALSLTSGWYYDAGSVSQVTIKGDAKSGSTVTVSVSGSYYNTYTTTAGSDSKYSVLVDVFNGWNYLTVSDGANWLYPTIYTTGGATYKNPINNVKVDGLTASSGGTDSDSWGNWSVSKSSVTITGNAKDGIGYWYMYGGSTYLSGSLEITGGVFSLPVSLDSGYNYVYLYDANWNYYSLTINNSATVSTVTLTADVYVGATQQTTLTSGWYYDVGTATQVTIKGSAKSGKTVTVYSYGTYTYTYTTTADSADKYSVTVDLSSGYNYIYVTDGSNWLYPTVYTTLATTATYKAPINNVKVDGVACTGCDDASTSGTWSISKTGITISGNASASGNGYWYHYNSSWSMKAYGTLNISSGTFSFPLDLDSGYNYIYLYDSMWNSYYMTINTSGSTVIVTFNTFVYDAGGTTQINTSGWGYYDAVSASSVTIKGDAKSGKTVTIYLSNYDTSPSTYKTYTATADATNKYAVVIDIFKGYNYLSVTDGSNYQYPTVYTTGGAIAKAPVYGVKVDNVTCSGCTDSSTSGTWNISASSVTISGSASASGNGYWYLYNSSWSQKGYGTLSITNGAFSFPLDLENGNNYIYLYDSQWNYFYATITTSGGVTAVTFNAFVFDSTGTTEITLGSNWYYNAGTASQVTIKGAAKSGKTVTIYLSNYDTYPSQYVTYTTTAGTGDKFSMLIDLFYGYNYLTVTDGYDYKYPTVYTAGGTTVKAAINNVKVDGAACSGCTDSSTSGTWGSSTAPLTASNVTISGNVKATGNGSWYWYGTYGSGSGTLNVSNGAFSFPLNLDNGYNYITLYDSMWNSYYMTIYTSGGATAAKKIVAITSPKHNDSVSGTISVTGTIDKAAFTPAYIYGYVYDYSTYNYQYFYWSTSGTMSGYGAITYDSTTGNFSFSASIGGTSNSTFIEVYAVDSNYYSHEHYIYVNNLYGYGEYSYKPGAGGSETDNAGKARAQAHLTEFHKMMATKKGR
jgi:hypothetical protein